MTTVVVGAYWHDRSLTLQEYASLSKRYISILKNTHSALSKLTWVGNKSTPEIALTPNSENLDDLIYKYAGDAKHIYTNSNPDGTPTWESTCALGYSMRFHNGKTDDNGGISISIRAGKTTLSTFNSITVTFSENSQCNNLIDYLTQKRIILEMISFWKPDFAKTMLLSFSNEIANTGFTKVGWLTYIKNTNASAMRNNPDLIAAGIEMEPVSIGGTLFSIDREMVSPDNEVQVARAKLLRAKLMGNHLIDS